MKCTLCWDPVTRQTKDSHHRIKQSKGGQEFSINKIVICTRCHRLIHTGESLLGRGRDTESVLDFYRSTLSALVLSRDIEEVSRALFEAAKEAAFITENAPRVLQPVEVKVPIQLLKMFTQRAIDSNVSRNDLFLWCMRECIEGRCRLPNETSR